MKHEQNEFVHKLQAEGNLCIMAFMNVSSSGPFIRTKTVLLTTYTAAYGACASELIYFSCHSQTLQR